MTEQKKPTAAEQRKADEADRAATDTRNTGGFATATQPTSTKPAIVHPEQVAEHPELVYDSSSPALAAHRVADNLALRQAAKAGGAPKGQGADVQPDVYPASDPRSLGSNRDGVQAEDQARAVRQDTQDELDRDAEDRERNRNALADAAQALAAAAKR